jgi:hypothetical protein
MSLCPPRQQCKALSSCVGYHDQHLREVTLLAKEAQLIQRVQSLLLDLLLEDSLSSD